MKEDLLDPENSTYREQTGYLSYKREGLSVKSGAQRAEPRVTEDNSKTLKCNGVCPAGVLNCLGPVIFFSLPFFPI